ncbi:MAG: high frequency lysogenization protein HflD [Alphaproteobacteria bacterium]
MDLPGLVLFGGLVGMQHALEADHLAAVAAMSAEHGSRRRVVLRGAWWGAGHTLALFILCGAVVLFGLTISARTEAALEFGVGAMIVVLGGNVLWTALRRRIHFHVHHHGDHVRHVHAHSHEGEAVSHAHSGHDHAHPPARFGRALAVGLVHGAAGSAGLLVLAVAAAESAWSALAYVAAFGAGSILGMAALSLVASWPLGMLERGAGWLNAGSKLAIGVIAVFIGARLMLESTAGI